MKCKLWARLKKGDTIVCPGDGLPERVLFARPLATATHVRTERHDHTRLRGQKVEVVR